MSQQSGQPTVIGSSLTVATTAALGALPAAPLTPGTGVYNLQTASIWTLEISSATPGPGVVAVVDITGMRWIDSAGPVPGGFVTVAELAATTIPSGASLVGVNNGTGLFTEPDVQHVLETDVVTKIQAADSTGAGGTSLIATQNTGGYYSNTKALETYLQAVGAKDTTQDTNIAANTTAIALRPLTTDLASTASGKGASLIGVHATGNTVEADLATDATNITANTTAIALRPTSATLAAAGGAALIGVADADGLLAAPGTVEVALRNAAVLANRAVALTLPVPSSGGIFAMFDPMNLDRNGDASLADGAALGTIADLGSLGLADDLTQATGANKPLYRKIAVAGKIGDMSAIDSPDTLRFASSAAFTLVTQRILLAVLFRPSGFSGTQAIMTGADSTEVTLFLDGSGTVTIDAGIGGVGQGLAATVNKWNIVLADFNGATTKVRLNGAQNNSATPGAGGMTKVSLMARPNGTLKYAGMIGFAAAWAVTIPAYADVENYLATRCQTAFGSFPV